MNGERRTGSPFRFLLTRKVAIVTGLIVVALSPLAFYLYTNYETINGVDLLPLRGDRSMTSAGTGWDTVYFKIQVAIRLKNVLQPTTITSPQFTLAVGSYYAGTLNMPTTTIHVKNELDLSEPYNLTFNVPVPRQNSSTFCSESIYDAFQDPNGPHWTITMAAHVSSGWYEAKIVRSMSDRCAWGWIT